MRLRARSHRISNVFALLVVLTAAIGLLSSLGIAQKAGQPRTEKEVVSMLEQGISSDDTAKDVQKYGITFQVTASTEKEIRNAGGTDELIRVLRSVAPPSAEPPKVPKSVPATSPAVLMIESNPGQSQVYVDDEPAGTTSQGGRLKLTHLAAGQHHVRVSQSGYQEYEETVSLTSGQVTTVAATLQQPTAPPVFTPPQTPKEEPEPPTNPGSGQPGYLGVQAARQQTTGGRGVMISGTAPGGPADQAGLKTSDTIMSVNGTMVTTPQQLKQALSSHQAGEVVQITWSDASNNTITRQVRLAAAPSQNPSMPQPQPPQQPEPQPSLLPHTGAVSFPVAHDHGQNGQAYCVGVMSIGNGMIYYQGTKGTNGVHNYEIPLNTLREARRNTVYLVALGAFHIRTKKGSNFNFVALDQQSKPGPPDAVLTAIDNAMGK